MTTEQTEALSLADWLDAVGNGGISTTKAAAELRRQHTRITELESQLAQRFDAADMATAAAQGFRDGVASVSAGSEPVTNNRPSLEEVFRRLSDRAYCNYIEQIGRDACLGWEHKAAHGKFGEAELKGHTVAGEMLGRHKAFAEAANALRGSGALLTYPSHPQEGMAGWMPIETAPKDKTNVILLRQACGSVANGFWLAEAYAGNGSWIWPYVHKNPTHWIPAPPIASEAKGAGHA